MADLPNGWTVDANGIPQPPRNIGNWGSNVPYQGDAGYPTGLPRLAYGPPGSGLSGLTGATPGAPSMGYSAAGNYPTADAIESGVPGMTINNSQPQDQGLLSKIGSLFISPAEAAGFNPDGTPSTAAPFRRLTLPDATPAPAPTPTPVPTPPPRPAPVVQPANLTMDNRPPPVGGPEKKGANPAGNIPVSSSRLRDLTHSGDVGPIMPGAPFPRLVPGGGMQNTPMTGGGGDIAPRGPVFPQLTDPGAVATAPARAPMIHPTGRRAPAPVQPVARAPVSGPLQSFASPPPQPDSPFTMVMRPNAPANYGGRGGGGPALTTALDLSGYRPNAAPLPVSAPPPAPHYYNLGYGDGSGGMRGYNVNGIFSRLPANIFNR